jgi:hypothetical protein
LAIIQVAIIGINRFIQVSTVRITENFASNTEKQYLAELEKELSKPDPITDLQKEQKIADTLAKLVTLADVAETANNWYVYIVMSIHFFRLVSFASWID